ncbi:hypothetical protein AU252_12240 [Pseudarthrobacter sulfonivorans]|uniref:Phosphodiester glycosidase domain-containing protein n=1 Tax=Pseudarthrobacter sulfonivorans TaxID=121292 RepID=A0A0U3PHK2_9MICC|nr:phosphodiester glycosidase family protein [Pseudarthrobacter sulfonivorans]ALV41832.1 hypothetical protein AU252_12240 [Pseudarthrobacter sulfonivorans]
MNTRSRPRQHRSTALLTLAGLALTASLVSGPAALAAPAGSGSAISAGPRVGAGEDTTHELAPGLTHTILKLGDRSAVYPWTVQLTLPSGDPGVKDSNVSTQEIAEGVNAQLRETGLDARTERVDSLILADAGGYLGHRVRVGAFAAQKDATSVLAAVKTAGYGAGTWYTGWDGDSARVDQADGPLDVQVLTVDPRTFRGEVEATFGQDIESTETTSAMAQDSLAGVNAGFFVFGPEHGAPGDPAGAGAYDGRILSETVGQRPALVIDHRYGRARVERLTWDGSISSGALEIGLDGLNRVPGLIRNCGGVGDSPTDAPMHDVTCNDADETIAFTADFGPATPSGSGRELVLDPLGKILEVKTSRGTVLAEGQTSVQATGSNAEELSQFAASTRYVDVTNRYLDEDGHVLRMTPHTQVLNGGPMLVQDGQVHVSAARDGMVHQDNPGMFYGWVHQRNPRTLAGIDDQGRLVLITADGRQTGSVGLSIAETAQLATELGLRDAINLDGGGSTAMVVGGQLTNSPSGGTERAVGDAIVIRKRVA